MSFRLVPISVTSNDLERRNGGYFTEFGVAENDLWQNSRKSLLYLLVRVQCRRRESSRSLCHLLMSVVLKYEMKLKTY